MDAATWPTATDVETFLRRGWITSPRVLPDELLDDVACAIDAYYLGERDHPMPLAGGYLDWRPEHGEAMRLNDYVSMQSDGLRTLVTWPALARAAARFMGSEVARLFHDQLVSKPPGHAGIDTTVGWHTDRAYWLTCTSTRMVTAWIPLQDCTVDAGPLAFVDGSHTWPDTDWMKTFNDTDLAALEARVGRPLVAQTLTLRRGEVSFHHARTIHGSQRNRSDGYRTALVVHYQDGENRRRDWRDPTTGRAAVHMNDALCRRLPDGTPDYADPGVCPVLWPT